VALLELSGHLVFYLGTASWGGGVGSRLSSWLDSLGSHDSGQTGFPSWNFSTGEDVYNRI
jgi:hypothetical protein